MIDDHRSTKIHVYSWNWGAFDLYMYMYMCIHVHVQMYKCRRVIRQILKSGTCYIKHKSIIHVYVVIKATSKGKCTINSSALPLFSS